MKNISIILLFCVISATAKMQTGSASADVRGVVKAFESALEEKNLDKIGALVSADIVVFENGYRNDGWPDFRDHHLIPEFKQATSQYTSSIVKLDIGADMAWAYSRTDRKQAKNSPQQPDFWAIYFLRRESAGWKIVVLNWSVRRINE